MDPILNQIQSSTVALWIAQDAWAFPVLLVLHAIGLAVGVGVFLVISLRALGVGAAVSTKPLKTFMPLAWLAIAITAISGVIMFLPEAARCYHSVAFRGKLVSIALGVALMLFIERQFLENQRNELRLSPHRFAPALPSLAIVVWISAIAAGRLIAYGV